MHHDNNRHKGITVMIEEIKRKYHWDQMKKMVRKYVENCEICLRAKYERHPTVAPLERTETPTTPMQGWMIDIFFYKNKKYLTFIDKFSKYALCKELSTY